MRVKVKGAVDPATSERFHRYMGESPARREGWVQPESVEHYQVTADYLDPFKEVAANFGLVVEPVGAADGTGGDPVSG